MNKNQLLQIYKIYHPENKMRCPIHFCLGQEALASCASIFLKKNDYVLSHHRSHGYYLAKKSPVNKMISEFFGTKNGSNFGLAGSQELSYSKTNFYSGTILSGMFSIALGTSFAQKMKKNKDITMTVIGDGGMEEGIVYETLNLASLHSLPIVFICENNNFSVHTNINERTKSKNFKDKVMSFDIEYLRIAGYDINSIFQVVKKAFIKTRQKIRPVFIEIDTMRTCGHVGPENDDLEFNYRNKELSAWKKKDTFKNMRLQLVKLFNEKIINKIDSINKNNIKLSVNQARKEKIIDFKKSLDVNFVQTYSKIIKNFSKPKKMFDKGQLDTKLIPY